MLAILAVEPVSTFLGLSALTWWIISAAVTVTAAGTKVGLDAKAKSDQEDRQAEMKKVQADAQNRQELALRKANSVSKVLGQIKAINVSGEAKSQVVLQKSFAADALTEIGDLRRERSLGKAIKTQNRIGIG